MLLLNNTHKKYQRRLIKAKYSSPFLSSFPKPWLLSEADFQSWPLQITPFPHLQPCPAFFASHPVVIYWNKLESLHLNIRGFHRPTSRSISGHLRAWKLLFFYFFLSWFNVLSPAEYFSFSPRRAGDWKWKEMYSWRLKSPLQIECIKHLCYLAAWCINSNIK